MASADAQSDGACTSCVPALDADSAEWLRALCGSEADQRGAQMRLHALLVRIAHAEVRRRNNYLQIIGPELDDVAYQAAADAMMKIIERVGEFRGESRFTTWAYKFVMFEVSTKIGRHFWRRPGVPMDVAAWDRLPDQFGLDPARESEWQELMIALRRAVDEVLTERQRRIFIAIALNGVPLDALVVELCSNRNAIYKMLFDARKKLRASLVASGHLDAATARHV